MAKKKSYDQKRLESCIQRMQFRDDGSRRLSRKDASKQCRGFTDKATPGDSMTTIRTGGKNLRKKDSGTFNKVK
jgi:hypothetical protein